MGQTNFQNSQFWVTTPLLQHNLSAYHKFVMRNRDFQYGGNEDAPPCAIILMTSTNFSTKLNHYNKVAEL